jgi:hypothetical protein
MAQGTKADRDQWERRFAALEKALDDVRGDLMALRAEVLGDEPAPRTARRASVTVGAPAPAAAPVAAAPALAGAPDAAPAAAAPSVPGPSAGPDERRMVMFLDAFYKAKGQRLLARDVAQLARDCGLDPRETAAFYLSDHPLLKVDGSERVLTMAGRKLYSQKRHLVG